MKEAAEKHGLNYNIFMRRVVGIHEAMLFLKGKGKPKRSINRLLVNAGLKTKKTKERKTPFQDLANAFPDLPIMEIATMRHVMLAKALKQTGSQKGAAKLLGVCVRTTRTWLAEMKGVYPD